MLQDEMLKGKSDTCLFFRFRRLILRKLMELQVSYLLCLYFVTSIEVNI